MAKQIIVSTVKTVVLPSQVKDTGQVANLLEFLHTTCDIRTT